MSFSADRRTLLLARSVIAARSNRGSRVDTAYTFYVAVLVVALVAIPIVRLVVLGLATSMSPAAPEGVAAAAAALAAGALLLGRTRGPAVPRPFLTEFLLGSPLARSLTLLRPFLISGMLLACSAAAVAGILVGARLLAAESVGAGVAGTGATGTAVTLFVGGSVCYAVVLAVLWLIGQAVPMRLTIPLAAVILASAVAILAGTDGLLTVTPWGWLASSWAFLDRGMDITPVPLLGLLLSPLVLLAVPRLLRLLRSREVMAQSLRWQTIGTLVQTGDVAAATGVLRYPPNHGRRIRLSLSRWLPRAVVQRDVVAALRFPARTALGSAGLIAAGWLLCSTAMLPSGIHWLAAGGGALLAYLSVGVWCDGLRTAHENAGRASLYGGDDFRLIGCHALLPIAAITVLGSLGAIAAVAAGAPALSLLWWPLIALFVVIVRIFDCAKGPMPIGLLLPVPTPMGDASMLSVIAWQADSVIIVAAIAGGLTVLFVSSGMTAAVWLVLAAAAVLALAVRRIRVLGP